MNRSHHHEKAFIELYNEYSDHIFRFCFVRLRDREKALDATQEVFFKMWNEVVKNPQKFQELGSPKAFLFRIARNTIIDTTRKKTSTPLSWLGGHGNDDSGSTLEPVEIAHKSSNPEEQLQMTELLDHLELLDPHHREILVFRFLHDMSVIDIAELLQISENATSVRIHRALDHARKKLHHLYE